MSNNFRLTTAAALGLVFASVAAPLAFADVPGYELQDLDQQSTVTNSCLTARAAIDAQIAAANRKADEALTTAQKAMQHAMHQR
jgi:hypothetical protein